MQDPAPLGADRNGRRGAMTQSWESGEMYGGTWYTWPVGRPRVGRKNGYARSSAASAAAGGAPLESCDLVPVRAMEHASPTDPP